MPNTAKGWEFEGDARDEIDRAIAEWPQDRGSGSRGEPNIVKRTVVRTDGSEFEAPVLFVDDVDGWWDEYAHTHRWRALTGVQYEDIAEKETASPDVRGFIAH